MTARSPRVRVAQCYTGAVGTQVLRTIAQDPRVELVAVLVHDSAKAGIDSGSLIGTTSGVTTTDDLDTVIAARPDVAIWSGQPWEPERLARLLAAGIDVYCGFGAFFLDDGPESELLRRACERGGSTLAAGGNIPGLISDVLPIFLTGYSTGITAVTAAQRNHVASYPSAFQLRHGLGLGEPVPAEGERTGADRVWERLIPQSAALVAAALGVEHARTVISKKEFALAEREATLPVSGLRIAAGTVAGVRWTFTSTCTGTCGDRDFLTVTNEQTAVLGLGPGWRASHDEPAWRVDIAGTPPITATVGWPADEDPTRSNLALNAARAVNFACALVDAEPGWTSVLGMPMITGATPIPSAVQPAPVKEDNTEEMR